MKLIIQIIFFSTSTYCLSFGQEKVAIKPTPSKLFVESGETKQFLNCDFLVKNNTLDTITITKIAVSTFDKSGHVLNQRFLDNNGIAPSIQTIPNRIFIGKESKLIFNPLSEFNVGLALHKIEFQFTFSSNQDEEFTVKTDVYPEVYSQKIKYYFPLKGKILVYDGHEYYAHHRRFDYEFEPIKQLGIASNFMRYAYDFVMLDSANNQFKGDKENELNYFGFGKKVYAVADGKVIYASNSHKDDKTFNIPEIANDPLELYGNCIAIQHKDSSISIYGHLKQNSLKVKNGDSVAAKQEIAAIGISGSSFFPHLHFEVRTSILHSAEGLPSYFSKVYLLESEKTIKIKSGLVETGSIIIAK